MRSSKVRKRKSPENRSGRGRLRAAAALSVTAACALLAGCTGARRTGEGDYHETLDRLSRSVVELTASPEKSRIEGLIAQLRHELPARVAGEEAARRTEEERRLRSLARAVELSGLDVGFATEVKDWTGDGASDGVQLYFSPVDNVSDAVKLPGTLTAELRAQATFGRGRELDGWRVSPEELANSWNEALFPSYVLRLPWHGPAPEPGRALLEVQFEPIAGTAKQTTVLLEVPRPGSAQEEEK